jgi:hypothetical protein
MEQRRDKRHYIARNLSGKKNPAAILGERGEGNPKRQSL